MVNIDRRKVMLPSILLLILGILGVLLWKGLSLSRNDLGINNVDKSIPKILSLKLGKDKHKITLLHIWATWCHSCLQEHAFWMGLAKKPELSNIQLVSVNYHDETVAAQQWLQTLGDPYHHLLWDDTGKLALELGLTGTPETFLIDPQGIIRYHHRGPLDEELWQSQLLPQVQKIK